MSIKQHITIDQLNKLSEEQFNKLKQFFFPKAKESPIFLYSTKTQLLLSIGEMIEFLYERDYLSKIESPKNWIEEGQWTVWDGIAFNDGDELCDVLWESVKEIL
jgi:hypothetical protein